MFTSEELNIRQETEVDNARDVIQVQLNVLMTSRGAIDIKKMDPREIEFAIHLLRQYLAMLTVVLAEQAQRVA